MIVLVLNNFNSGGAERIFLTIASYLKEKQESFKVISINDFGVLKSDYEKVAKIEILPRSYILRTLLLIKTVFLNKKDFYLCNSLESSIYFAMIGVLTAQEKSITLRIANNIDNIKDRRLIKKIFIKFVIWACYHKFKIIANSESSLKDYKSINGAIDGLVIPNPINLSDFFSVRSFNKSKDGFIRICSVARLHPQKNLEYLLDVFEQLVNQKLYRVVLEIVGDGPEESRLIERSKNLPVVFIKPPVDIAHFFKNKDLFMLFPTFEGFGNVYVEALAAGLPLITWRCKGGMNEVVSRLSPIRIFENDSSQTIANKTHAVIRDRILRCKYRPADQSKFEFLCPDLIICRYIDYVCSE